MPVPANVLPSDSTPNNILQFNILRDPQKYPTEAIQRRFIRYAAPVVAPQGYVYAGPAPVPDLITQLTAASLTPGVTLNVLVDLVTKFKNAANPDYISTTDQLFQQFKDFTIVYEWLQKQDRNATVANLQVQIENAAGLAAGQLFTLLNNPPYDKNNLILWENFVAEVIVPTDGALSQHITNILRINWMVEKIINNDPGFQNGQDIYEAARATLLLPSPVFPLPAPLRPVPFYRLVNPNTGDHLYTTSKQERDNAIALSGYNSEGIACRVYNVALTGTVPLYRCVKKGHFYTADLNEKNYAVTNLGFTDEGIACYVFPSAAPKSLPLYRYYNVNADLHFYTTSLSEGNYIVNNAWLGEKVACYVFSDDTWPDTKGTVKPCFIADFKTVQTQLLLYAKGEIAQINNLMSGESNSHVVRNFDRQEQVVMTDVQTTTTTEKETQETDKNELSVAASQILKEDLKLDVGVNVSLKFPSASIQTKTGFSYQNSKETSNQTASKISKDVMNRALTSITQSVRQQTTVTTIHETEDTNTHAQDNSKPGAVPVSAIYRWVDKYYLASLVSYGPRTIIDLVIPEPAAFYIYCKSNKKSPDGIVVKKPILPSEKTGMDPATGLQSFQDLFIPEDPKPGGIVIAAPGGAPGAPAPPPRTANWQTWSALYGADAIQPPPPLYKSIGISYARFDVNEGRDANTNDKLLVDPGYEAIDINITCTLYEGGAGDNDGVHNNNFNWVIGQAGNVPFDFTNGKPLKVYAQMYKETGLIPVSFRADSKQYALNIEVTAKRTQEAYDQWRISTYNAIIAGYGKQLQAYKDWIKAQQADSPDNDITGNNPDDNREVEKEELKKACLELLTAQRFESFSAMSGGNDDPTPPEFDFTKAEDEGRYSRFFEDAIEWPLISYMFYPYFWGRKSNWQNVKQVEDKKDPLFTKFLQAGAARVIIPIRPNFEGAINHYLCCGQIWNGGDVPAVDSDLYVSIADEMKEAAGHFANQKVVDQWTVKVPTSFVIIDDPTNTAVLPDNSAQLGYTGNLDDLI